MRVCYIAQSYLNGDIQLDPAWSASKYSYSWRAARQICPPWRQISRILARFSSQIFVEWMKICIYYLTYKGWIFILEVFYVK